MKQWLPKNKTNPTKIDITFSDEQLDESYKSWIDYFHKNKISAELISEINNLIDTAPSYVRENSKQFKIHLGIEHFNSIESEIIEGKYQGFTIKLEKKMPKGLIFIK